MIFSGKKHNRKKLRQTVVFT